MSIRLGSRGFPPGSLLDRLARGSATFTPKESMPKTESELEAEDEGGNAYHEGASESDNPHEVGTNEHLSWNDGFFGAQSDEDDEDD